MKMYVDELPRSCGDCEFFKETADYYYCDKLHIKLGYINKEKDCPLQSLADYNKQVIKETLDGLTISLLACFSSDEEFTRDEIVDWLKNIKDEI